MSIIQREQLLDQLNWRYATKQFSPTRKLSEEDWSALRQAITLTPSSFGLSPWKAVVVTDPAVKAKLVPASWGQSKVADASHVVVFAIKRDLSEADIDFYLQRISEVRGVAVATLTGFRDAMVASLIQGRDQGARADWAARQVYIALGNLLTSAAALGIDACPMEGFEPEKYDEILGLKAQGLTATVLCVLGYRAPEDKYANLKKVRFEEKDLFLTI